MTGSSNDVRASPRINPAPCTDPSKPSAAPFWQGLLQAFCQKLQILGGRAPDRRLIGRSGGERGLGLVDDRLERRRFADRQIGEYLAVDRDPGLAEAVDKPAVS